MNLSIFKRVFCGFAAIFLFIAGLPVLAAAGAKIKIDDTKFFQIGMGYRGSLTLTEDAAPLPRVLSMRASTLYPVKSP